MEDHHMKKTTTFCDCCGKEIVKRGWEDGPWIFSVVSATGSQNPIWMAGVATTGDAQSAAMTFNETCSSCARKLASAVASAALQIRLAGQPEIT